MAKGSKKGACSARIEAAKSGCLAHNRRDAGRVPSYVNQNLTHLNHTIFEHEAIKDVKTLAPLIKKAEALYVEKVGQKCQKSFTPYREDVLSLPGRGDITDEQIKAYIRKAEAETGWTAMGAWYHKDEGYKGSKWIEGNEDFKVNYHVHVLWYCQDPETGKACRNDRKFFSLRQDFLAGATGMERGNKVKDTHIKGRTAAEQRIYAQEKRAEQIVTNAQEQAKDIISEAKSSLVSRAASAVGIGSKVTKARQQEREAVMDEIREASNLRINKEGRERDTPQEVGNALRLVYRDNKQLKRDIEAVKTESANKDKTITNANSQIASMKSAHKRALDAAREEAEREAKRKVEAANKELLRLRTLVFKLWPSAAKAVAAIVAKVNSTWQVLFTADQVKAIDTAMIDARDTKERIEWGKDLLTIARPDFTRPDKDIDEQVEAIARNGQNVQKVVEGLTR